MVSDNHIFLEYKDKKSRETILNNKFNVTVTPINKGNNNNLLLFGDNLQGLHYLLHNLGLKEKVDLIYIDPPYNTGRTFYMGGTISNTTDTVAYIDNEPLHIYLENIRERLILLYELLSPQGSLYLHCDYKIGHYLKIILDEIFGTENYRADITRRKTNGKNFKQRNYGNIKDCILFYTKTDDYIWNYPTIPYTEEDIQRLYPKIDENGERYTTESLSAPGTVKKGETGRKWHGLLPPKGRHWCTNHETLDYYDSMGLIEWSKTGNPRKIVYAKTRKNKGKPIQDIIDYRDPTKPEYPTSKNKDLLRTIIGASSNKDSIILDCYAGSGTTIETGQELKRRTIGIDKSPESIRILKEKFKNDKQYKINTR